MTEQKELLQKEVEKTKNNSEETLTEVTSIASEEERTGEKIETPNPEELVAKSGMAMIQNRKHLSRILPKLGKKALQRIILASLDLPQQGAPVKLISQEEKLAFRLCQSTIRAMFTVMFYHTSEEIIKKHKAKEDSKETETPNQSEEQCQTDKEPTKNSQ